MKETAKLFVAFAAASMMFSCSDEPANNGGNEAAEGDFHATLALSLPVSGRSATDNPGGNPAQSTDGFEYGQDYENNVQDIVVVLAEKEASGSYKWLACSGRSNASEVNNGDNGAAGKPNPLYRIKFSTDQLINAAEKEVYIFAYCNPSEALVTECMASTWNPATSEGNIASNPIWTNNKFLMTNALESHITLPSYENLKQNYNTESNPFNLGVVKVERAAARFDFAETTVEGQDIPNRYPIVDYVNIVEYDKEGNIIDKEGNTKEVVIGYANIDAMALFNQPQEFYNIPRVAADDNGAASATFTLMGQETPVNWVVSPATKTWNFPLKDAANNSFDYTLISTLNKDDNPDNWDNGNKTSYKIWTYTTENTLPSKGAQMSWATTGVKFRAWIEAVETADKNSVLEVALASQKPIYSYEGVMYGNLDQLKVYVKTRPQSAVANAFYTTWNLTTTGVDFTNAEQVAALVDPVTTDLTTSEGTPFNMYKYDTEAGKYYMYYTYYNRHNDNYTAAEMGIMEFATVRNNVYKLNVSNVYSWGEAGDKHTPDVPDEDPKVYFRVQCEVLPWVVRVNSIIL